MKHRVPSPEPRGSDPTRGPAAVVSDVAERPAATASEGLGRAAPATFRRPAEARAGPRRLIVAIGLGLAVVVVKPWGAAAPPPPVAAPPAIPASAPAAGSPAGPAASLPAPADPDLTACLGLRDWSLVTLELSGERRIRTWTVVMPGRAAGPVDPALPVAHVAVTGLVGLGFCAPAAPRPSASADPLAAWLVVPRGGAAGAATARPLGSLVGLTARVAGAAALERPPSGPSWAAGRYVFELPGKPAGDVAPGQVATAWLAVDVTSSTEP